VITSPKQYWGKIGQWLKEFSYRLNMQNSGQLGKYASYLSIFSFFGGEFVAKNRVLLCL